MGGLNLSGWSNQFWEFAARAKRVDNELSGVERVVSALGDATELPTQNARLLIPGFELVDGGVQF